MKDDIIKIKGVICEFEPGEKVYLTLEGLDTSPLNVGESEAGREESFFQKIMKEHFSSYIKEEEKKEEPYIDMTDAINEFYEKENNPKHRKGRYMDFVYNVHNNLGLAVVAYGGQDFDEYLGCIDAKGNYVIPRNFQIGMDYGEGLFATYNGGLSGGYINLKGETVIPFKYIWVSAFENGYAWVQTHDHESQYIDKTGRTVMRITEYYKINGKDIYGETLEELKENVLKLENTKHKTK
jgi:hypothetical protein